MHGPNAGKHARVHRCPNLEAFRLGRNSAFGHLTSVSKFEGASGDIDENKEAQKSMRAKSSGTPLGILRFKA